MCPSQVNRKRQKHQAGEGQKESPGFWSGQKIPHSERRRQVRAAPLPKAHGCHVHRPVLPSNKIQVARPKPSLGVAEYLRCLMRERNRLRSPNRKQTESRAGTIDRTSGQGKQGFAAKGNFEGWNKAEETGPVRNCLLVVRTRDCDAGRASYLTSQVSPARSNWLRSPAPFLEMMSRTCSLITSS
jgi:hypothetical protein